MWLKQRSTLEQQVGAPPPRRPEPYRMSGYGRLWWRLFGWIALVMFGLGLVGALILALTRAGDGLTALLIIGLGIILTLVARFLFGHVPHDWGQP